MDCRQVQENLVAFLHGELTRSELQAVHAHLGNCETCLNQEIEYRQTSRVLAQSSWCTLPADFDVALDAKIKVRERTFARKPGAPRYLAYSAAATVLIWIGLELLFPRFGWFQAAPPSLASYPTTQAIFQPVKPMIESWSNSKSRIYQKLGLRDHARQ
ncbi:anti-sigma factor [candidate division KSB1 bacterium]|nr:anti-sigma factor [candidate division KSB1 bacterium]